MAKSIVFLFAAVALFMGLFFLRVGWSSRRAGAEASRLRGFTATDLRTLPVGTPG